METYCLKCKEKREMQSPVAGFTATGGPITRGICVVCGGKLARMGHTPEHDSLPKPEIIKPEKKAKAAGKKSKSGDKKKSSARNGRRNSTSRTAIKPIVIGKGKDLVIVESPAKARTVGKFLGDEYRVMASVGHVRDLVKSQLSVDVENNFAPRYRVDNEKREIVKEIGRQAERSKTVYLATDPDREGESIAWHIRESAEIPSEKTQRVVFHEITRDAVEDAFQHPRELDMDLVDAQQARRILDRLVGFKISPILWARVKNGLSAGRVQSVALRLIVEREREIQAFVPVEYWVIHAILSPQGSERTYKAKLIRINSEEFQLPNLTAAESTLEDLRAAVYKINSIQKRPRTVKPAAPFITSTLQQEASRKLGFLSRRTMMIAQQLYEGIDLGNGEVTGLITYMRTDSVHVSKQAVDEARRYVRTSYGDEYVPASVPTYRTRAKSAQEAHEAIRPTSVNLVPEKIQSFLSPEQYRLYKLIWQRFVASQMSPAKLEITTVDILGTSTQNKYLLRAGSTVVVFPGFKALYEESVDDGNGDSEEQTILPLDIMKEKQVQILRDLESQQLFTQPPPRYSEASLIAVLEENKIGRPSTYAPILSTIQDRGYVVRKQKSLHPTEIGFIVNDKLVEFFPSIVDIGFTSDMEDRLDEIASGKLGWIDVIQDFYTPFEKLLANAQENMPKTRIEPKKIGRSCPECGHDLVLREGRYGKFISCSNFPACRYTEPYLETLGIECPKCREGKIVKRKGKSGKPFYGCSRFPDCDFIAFNKPLKEPCSNCGGTLVETSKRQSKCLACGNVSPIEAEEVNQNV